MSEVRGSGLECQAAIVQEHLRGATLHLRSGVGAGRRHPVSEVRAAAGRSPAFEASGGREKPTCTQGQGQ